MFVMMAITFLSFAQIGRVLSFGNDGFNSELIAFQKVHHLCIFIYDVLMSLPETVQSPPRMVRSKTVTTQIPISIDEVGCPELPTTTMADGYKAKIVQSMLREYCTAHIREHSFNSFAPTSNIHQLGFITGKKMQVIPWGTLVKDPSSWISNECFPNGFEWKDPSKIQVGEIFRLLDHWRDRQDQGLDPLIWVPVCPLFEDVNDPLIHGRTLRQATVSQMQDSDGEVFVLPSSEESDKKDDESDDNESLEESSSMGNSSDNAESITMDVESLPMLISRPLENSSGEPDIYLLCFEPITYASCGSNGRWRRIRNFTIQVCKC
jgi:hypothetical protein